ncbi:MAG TPA: PEP/pyruvate-binding domain-containing protein [Polyangiaceae bacterium]|nr:PEP/pyruvate-binding domain-containing protein [Polyangiaceae bacterium]
MLGWLVSCVVALAGCGRWSPPRSVRPEDPGFNDFTAGSIRSLPEFRQLAAVPATIDDRPAIAGAKFVITEFSEPQKRRIRFLDGRQYRFHDEWAWFRLLNGQPVSGFEPLAPHPFSAPEQARRWALDHEEDLPEGLEITEGRLYARHFYDLSLAKHDRMVGAGSLIHVEGRADRAEIWGFEVDYTDSAEPEQLLVFFSELEKVIPEPARAHLSWFARSPEQLEMGKRLMRLRPELRGRVMTYNQVSVPGETAVYTGGIVAGRLRVVEDLARLGDAEPGDILLLGALPEYLPQARGLVTAVPQTPLAHLNLLAKSRQIVNAYRGGVLEDLELRDWARSGAPVLLVAEQGRLRFQRLTEREYESYQALLRPEPLGVPYVNTTQLPYIVDLSTVDSKQVPALSTWIGGKAAGMAQLLNSVHGYVAASPLRALRVDVPDRPLVITIRAYREHVAPMLPELRALFADPNFLRYKQLRYLALEGAERFVKRYPGKKNRELARSYQNARALGPIAAVVRKGGVRHMVRHAPLSAELSAELRRVLPRHFGAYSADQGLRFRSSSTVEDIEGFNGAGLYTSNTGFLERDRSSWPVSGKGKRPSVADAVKKTWASYFGAEAFEERHLNHIDHLSADMAVLVHARFEDTLEQSNGVFTFTWTGSSGELAVDAQPGAVSVTNPPTDRVVIPESSRVRRGRGELVIDRQSLSSLTNAGEQVLKDAELRELFSLAEALTVKHLLADNQGVSPAQQRRTLVLDFEFRRMAAGWPALQDGSNPARFIVKQMRPLEPSPRVSPELRSAPIPRDVLSRARRIESKLCQGSALEIAIRMVFTEPSGTPDVGYSKVPLVSDVTVKADHGAARVVTHLEQRTANVSSDEIHVEYVSGAAISDVRVDTHQAHVTFADGKRAHSDVRCESQLEYAEPRELLRSFLHASERVRPTRHGASAGEASHER